MRDILLEVGKNPQLKRLVSGVGLPVPQGLTRSSSPWSERPLEGKTVVVGGEGDLASAIALGLIPAGASPAVLGEPHPAFEELAEAYARPVSTLDPGAECPRTHGLVFDATAITDVSSLAQLHAYFQPRMRRLRPNGRALVLGRPPTGAGDIGAQTASRALEGFARSLAKEVGRKGATAHLVYVEKGGEERLPAILRFLLSERSAYISGQVFPVTASANSPESTPFTRPLRGKTALVTGSARGIGAATATALAREGATVVCLDLPVDGGPLASLARKIDGHALPQDLLAPDAPEAIAAGLKELGDGVDIVVHNAGITRDKTLGKMDADRWNLSLDVNLGAVVKLTSRLLDGVMRDEGRVLCMSSIAGIAGNFGQTNYAAAKSGLIGFVQGLAPRVADRGITVNALAPGFIETRMTSRMPVLTREVARRLCNLSQAGLPEDVAEAVVFLASPGAVGLTGTVIRVCGGNLLGA